jgi:hypothetical protein
MKSTKKPLFDPYDGLLRAKRAKAAFTVVFTRLYNLCSYIFLIIPQESYQLIKKVKMSKTWHFSFPVGK